MFKRASSFFAGKNGETRKEAISSVFPSAMMRTRHRSCSASRRYQERDGVRTQWRGEAGKNVIEISRSFRCFPATVFSKEL